ncbi:MAG: hypothetical protein WAO71_01405 [Gallionella sp.]
MEIALSIFTALFLFIFLLTDESKTHEKLGATTYERPCKSGISCDMPLGVTLLL